MNLKYVDRDVCEKLLGLMKPERSTNGLSNKVLNAPVRLGTMAANVDNEVDDIKSIWVMQRDDALVGVHYLLVYFFKNIFV